MNEARPKTDTNKRLCYMYELLCIYSIILFAFIIKKTTATDNHYLCRYVFVSSGTLN